MREFLEYLRLIEHKSQNTIVAYERDIKAFGNFVTEKRDSTLEKCTESDAIAYVMELSKENKSKATINRKISALRTFFERKRLVGLRNDNPFSAIKSAKNTARSIDYLSIHDVEALIEAADDSRKGVRDRALIEFMYGTGARVTEVVRLKWEDVNFRMSFVTLRDANDESRIVPMGKYAAEALKAYSVLIYPKIKGDEPKPADWVYINFRGEPLTRQGIWKVLKEYGTKIGIAERMTPQILRDTFAVHILQNGGDLKTLQELMGFDDMSVGIAYLSVTEIHVRDVYRRCHPRA